MMKWNPDTERFEAVEEPDLILERPPVQFCTLHEPPEWKPVKTWLREYYLSTRQR